MKYYTMTNSSSDAIISKKDSKINTPLLLSIFLIISGIVAILMPNVSTIVAETWIAVILAVSGVTKLIYAFQSREDGGFIWKLLLSILYIATGVYLFAFPLSGILTLTLLFGSFLLTEGVFELILAYQLRAQKNWGWLLTNAIVTLVLGGIVWAQWPSDAPWLIGTLLGVSILSTGISRLVVSLNPPSSSEGDISSSAFPT
jgi:uncharacterized membrane protein HdeD (DUF308 family)